MRRTHREPTNRTTNRRATDSNGVGTFPAPHAIALAAPMTPIDRIKAKLRNPQALEHMLGLGLWTVLAVIVVVNL